MFHRTMACLFLAAMLLSSVSAAAQTVSGGRIPFVIEAESVYQEGCMNGRCACPIFFLDGLRGRFLLAPDRRDGSRFHYDVRDLRLVLPEGQLGPALVTGHGEYWVDRANGTQRMQLELSLDGEPFRIFDSGETPVEGDGLRIAVLHEEGSCYGYSFELVARAMALSPTPRLDLPWQPKQPREGVSWTILKATYR